MAKPVDQVWNVEGIEVPVRLYREWRNNSRISITKDRVIIRVPMVSANLINHSHQKWAMQWLTDQFKTNSVLRDRFVPSVFFTGQVITTAYKSYSLVIDKSKLVKNKAQLNPKDSVIRLMISDQLSARDEEEIIRHLIYKCIAKNLKPVVVQRIHRLNKLHFNEQLNDVKIKNNKSNWGSCSARRNLNISFRTLFVPLEVQDYIFIHELAHLKELNHSERYWNIVQSAMPDYKEKERWLKSYGNQTIF